MTTELCLFCNEPEQNYQPGPDADFICSRCVIFLAVAEQGDLKKAHIKATDKGYKDKAKAIESFLIPEVKDGTRPEHKSVKRSVDRKGIARSVRA